MIATLSGTLSEKLLDSVIIEVNGVGYGVYVTTDLIEKLNIGDEVKLCIYEYVREQAHDLFGFLNREMQNFFEKLIDVNGIGPRMALNVLSIGSVEEIKQAIAGGDTAYIQQASGVGKRVAERIVVDLKDKVGLNPDLNMSELLSSNSTSSSDEAVQAMVALGFSTADAIKALKDVDKTLPTEDRLKLALKGTK